MLSSCLGGASLIPSRCCCVAGGVAGALSCCTLGVDAAAVAQSGCECELCAAGLGRLLPVACRVLRVFAALGVAGTVAGLGPALCEGG
eukprot:2899756-Amphidinium_carterae.1